jgi:RimJ/RimL family protein N-acetyltransferase
MIQTLGADNFPEFLSERLRLRAFAAADADPMTSLAGDRAVAATTLSIPHPYTRGDAERWIASHLEAWVEGAGLSLAITRIDDETLVGAISLMLDGNHRRAELGYWIGQPFWGRGYATEAARAMLDFGFGSMGLNRIFAHHMRDNPASGRVLGKIGMTREGVLSQHVLKWDQFRDVVLYGLTRERFLASKETGRPGQG